MRREKEKFTEENNRLKAQVTQGKNNCCTPGILKGPKEHLKEVFFTWGHMYCFFNSFSTKDNLAKFAKSFKELPKKLFFLDSAPCRLSKNEVQNLENMIHANKNYLRKLFFRKWAKTDLNVIFKHFWIYLSNHEILRSSKKSHFDDQSQFRGLT